MINSLCFNVIHRETIIKSQNIDKKVSIQETYEIKTDYERNKDDVRVYRLCEHRVHVLRHRYYSKYIDPKCANCRYRDKSCGIVFF